jgi:UMF1 family MFS transporter
MAPPAKPGDPLRGFLEKTALHRPELRAWAMYDWANSAMATTVIAALFPIYFSKVAGATLAPVEATRRFAIATTASLLVVAILSPLLGAIADYAAAKKRFLALFMGIGATATALMFEIHRGEWLLAAALFVLGNIGLMGSLVFYDSLLPHVAREGEIDRLSTAGYALGYVGGGILLALNLAWIQKPAWFGLPSGPHLAEAQATLPARLAFLSVALWWLLFSIPLFVRVREPEQRLEVDETHGMNPARVALTRISETFHELRGYRQALLMLVAFLIYSDGIGTIIRMATSYGTEIGIGEGALIGAILMVQFVGIPFSFLFGALASRIGAKRSIFLSLLVYAAISVLAYFMRTAAQFFALAFLVGTVQGGSQALSRSLFASMIPKHKSAEFFGLFSVFEKVAGILGPATFALTITLTGSSRSAILSVIAFFVLGGALLHFVDEEEGKRVARAADLGTRPAAPG